MAWNFDGSNDSLTNNNGVSNIDVAAFSIGGWVYMNAQPTGGETLLMTASSISSGNSAVNFSGRPPNSSGWKMQFNYRFSSTEGEWEYNTDLNTGQWYHVTITFDRSSTSNNPIIYVDGSSVTVNELEAPVGTGHSGNDSVSFGENVGASGDLDGRIAEVFFYNRIISAAEAYTLYRGSPGMIVNGLTAYWPFVRSKVDVMQGADLTIKGNAAPIAHPPVVYPTAQILQFPSAGVTAAITGTAKDSITESDITSGGKTVIITLTNDTWIAAGTGAIGTEAQSLAICQSLDSAQAEGTGWDAEVKNNFVHTDIARTSSTVATITIGAEASYDITAQETITMGDIASAVLTTSGTDITPSDNTFTVDIVAAGATLQGSLMMMGVGI